MEIVNPETPTPETLARFIEYAKDAGNWNGQPLVGGNVGGDKADAGFILNMKLAGLITTTAERPRTHGVQAPIVWMRFTAAGKALALQHGIKIDEG